MSDTAAQNLHDWQIRRGWGRQELADALDISREHITMVIRGAHNMSPALAKRIEVLTEGEVNIGSMYNG